MAIIAPDPRARIGSENRSRISGSQRASTREKIPRGVTHFQDSEDDLVVWLAFYHLVAQGRIQETVGGLVPRDLQVAISGVKVGRKLQSNVPRTSADLPMRAITPD